MDFVQRLNAGESNAMLANSIVGAYTDYLVGTGYKIVKGEEETAAGHAEPEQHEREAHDGLKKPLGEMTLNEIKTLKDIVHRNIADKVTSALNAFEANYGKHIGVEVRSDRRSIQDVYGGEIDYRYTADVDVFIKDGEETV